MNFGLPEQLARRAARLTSARRRFDRRAPGTKRPSKAAPAKVEGCETSPPVCAGHATSDSRLAMQSPPETGLDGGGDGARVDETVRPAGRPEKKKCSTGQDCTISRALRRKRPPVAALPWDTVAQSRNNVDPRSPSRLRNDLLRTLSARPPG